METIKRFKNFVGKFCAVCKDNTHLLLKSAADNHLRIQQCGKGADGSIQCAVTFSSYSELKRYQKKLRTATISLSSAIAMVLIAAAISPLIFNPSRSSAAIYSWTQTFWKAVPAGTTGDSSQADFADYASKDALVSLTEGTDPLSKVTLGYDVQTVSQTDNGTTNTGFNLSGRDLTGTTQVDGTGVAASVKLEGISGPVNAWDSNPRAVPFSVGRGSVMLRNGVDDEVFLLHQANFYKFSISKNTWTQLASFAATLEQYSGNMIRNGSDNEIYVTKGSGYGGFYKYSISDNAWTTLPSLPAALGLGSKMIRRGSDDYIYVARGGGYADFYRYSISSNSWTSLSPCPVAASSSSSALFGKTGGDELLFMPSGSSKGLYKYTISTNSWSSLADAPEFITAEGGAVYSSTEDAIYMTPGGINGYTFYKYLAASNAWSALSPPTFPLREGGGLIYAAGDSSIYMAIGNNSVSFLRYSISGNSWSSMSNVPVSLNYGSYMLKSSNDDKVYVLQGGATNGFHRYSVSGNSWESSVKTSLANAPTNINGGGFILARSSENSLYVLQGNGGAGFYKYNPVANTWTTLANTPATVPTTATYSSFMLHEESEDFIYVIRGGNNADFWKYSISGNSWTTLTSAPGGLGDGSMMLRNGTDGDIYVSQGGNSYGFYKYSISANEWTTLTAAPATLGVGSSMVRGGSEDSIYVTRGITTNGFYKYSISGNSWTALTNIPATIGAGSRMIRNGSDNDIYLVRGAAGAGFYKYSISGNSWTTLASTPTSQGAGAALLRNGSDGEIYLLRGGGFNNFYKYSISGNSWATLAPSLENISNGGGAVRLGDEIYVITGYGSGSIMRYIINQSAYYPSGTYVSGPVDTGQVNPAWANVSWNATDNGQSVSMKVRSAAQSNMSGADDWGSCSNISNGESLASGGCVHVGHRYLQYKATLSTSNTKITPSLDDITLGFGRYPTANQVLISSPYDSGDQYNMLSKVRFTADQTGGSVKFQLRAAASVEGLANAQWCGPEVCAANPGESGSFFADPLGGEEMNAALSDYQNKDNRYFQYAAFLSSTDGSGAPILDEVTIDYSYNKAPHLTNVIATQRDDGMVEVGYTVREEEGESIYPILAYNPQGVVLAEDIDALREGDVAIDSNSQPIPQSGQMVIGDELIQFVRKDANTLTIAPSGRALKFDGATYYTVAGAHAAGTPIYFKANRVSGEVSGEISIDPEYKNIEVARAALWDIKQEVADGIFAGPTFADEVTEGVTFRIIANDAQTHNNIGSGSSNALSIDLEAPTVLNISTTTETGRYRQGQVIPLTLQFSEPVSTPGQQEVVTNTGYTCLIYVDPATEASCDYVVQGTDNTEQLTAGLAATATVKDVYGNFMTDRAAVADNVSPKNIVIDNSKPSANFSAPVNGSFINKGEVKFTLSEELSSAILSFTATSSENGETAGTAHSLSLGGAELATLSEQTKEITGLVNSNTYTLSFSGTDVAGNVSDGADSQVTGISFDTREPEGSVEGPAAIEGKVYFNEDADIKVTADEVLRTNAFGENQQDKNYLKFTNVQNSQETVCTFSEQMISLFPAEDHALDFGTDCGGMTLGEGEYELTLHLIDRAGNAKDIEQAGFVYDVTAPRIFSFTSITDNTCGSSACGTLAEINITAVMTEPVVSGGMQIRLANTATPATDVTLGEISASDVSGTYVVQGPNLGHDTDDLAISEVLGADLADRAGNVQQDLSIPSGRNLSDNKNIVIDTGPPVLDAFSAPAGNYNVGDSFTVTADYSERLSTLNGGSFVRVVFSTGKTLELSAISSDKLTGTYTVEGGENAQSFLVTAIEAQNAVDLIGNPLTTQDLPSTNIGGVQVDTQAPALGSTPVSFVVAKTNSQTPTVNLEASDNFDLADGTMRYSLNGGVSWCAPLPYAAQTNSFDITAGACGGSAANEMKTLTVKFIDAAGNESATANAQIEYDNSKPVLEKITAEQGSGIYGPTDQIKIIAQYNEPLVSGSTLTVNLNNGKQLTLGAIENGNTLTAAYAVGATGSLEDTDKLKVAAIVSQSVSDTADPTNTQDSTSLAGISENIDSNKDIVIDTSAPTTSLKLDREAEDGKIKVALDPDDAGVDRGGMSVQIALSDSDGACVFAGAATESFTEFPQTFSYDDTDSPIRKACVKLTDGAGNVSGETSAIVPSTPEDFVYTDLTNGSSGFTGAILTWDFPASEGTGNFAKYALKWCASSDKGSCVPSETVEITSKEQNYHVFNSLSADSGYCYKVSFADNNGDVSKSSQTHCAVPGEGPKASGTDVAFEGEPFAGSVGMDTATVVFKTVDAAAGDAPLATTAVVEAYEDSALTSLKATASDPLGVTHAVKLTGLSHNTVYYLKITATDTSDEANNKRSETVSYTTGSALSFQTLGTLSKITLADSEPSVITDTKAVVSFATDQAAKCFVEYKEKAIATYNEVNNVPETEARKSHSIAIGSLLPSTEYDFKVTCSADGVVVGPIEGKSFVTRQAGTGEEEGGDSIAPKISGVSLADVTGETATVNWTTDEKANSLVIYEVEGGDYSMMTGNSLVNDSVEHFTTSHAVKVSNLIPATKYAFSVVSYDAVGNISQSDRTVFTTKEPSSLSSIQVVSKALGQATVSWQTSQATSSIVEYGKTTAYGDKKESSTKTKEHELTITDLEPGETYHFRVKGEDDAKNLYASSDITFQPKAPPKISDFKVDEVYEHGATITFVTNVPTDALIAYTDTEKQENSGLQGRPDYATKHSIKLVALEAGTNYSLTITVRDEEGNETKETFPPFETLLDEKKPEIDKVKTDAALTQSDKVQAIISWSTDEPATTTIIYREGRSGDKKELKVSDSLSTNHVAVVTTFKPGTVYYFNVESADASGNEAASSDFALLTPRRRENIIQVIVNNFQQIFGWVQR